MNAAQLLAFFEANAVALSLVDGQVALKAPRGVMTAELLATFKQHKQAIVAMLRSEAAARAPIGVRPDGAPCPTSFAQQRLWFLDQLEPHNVFYHIPAVLRLRGRIDLDALARALHEIVGRHAVLRTSFVTRDERPHQVIAAHADAALALPLADLSLLEPALRAAEAARIGERHSAAPFDLGRGPLLRAQLIRMAPDEHTLLICMHHIISDAWSMGILVREMTALYGAFARGLASPLPALPIQYADFACWQRQQFAAAVLPRQLDYWRAQLDGSPGLLTLPLDRPRGILPRFRGARQPVALSAALGAGLRALARQANATLFMVLAAGLNVLLQRYSGQYDICIGTPVSSRSRVETEGLIGFFVNTLVLRTRIDPAATFLELLAAVRGTALDAYAHADVPFEQLVEALKPERHLGHAPLFQVNFVMHNLARTELVVEGLQLDVVTPESLASGFDLTLTVGDSGGQLSAALTYNTDLFDQATAARMAAHLVALLDSALAAPATPVGQLSMLSGAERDQMLVQWNQTAAPYARQCGIAELFEARVRQAPAALAVVCEGAALRYDELNARANQLARQLRLLGVGPDVRVALCLERSPAMLVAILAVLKAGGAYVPLDPAYPRERLAFILDDARPAVLLTQASLRAALPAHGLASIELDTDADALARHASADLAPLALPENLAYVIYTSGSSGRPKGVAVRQRAAVNLVAALVGQVYAGLDLAQARIGVNASFAFDASVKQLLLVLHGVTLYLIPEPIRADADLLAGAIDAWALNGMDCTPTQLTMLLASPALVRLPDLLLIGGEAIEPPLWQVLRARSDCRFYNVYGPTEATVDTLVCAIDGALPMLGRPLANVQVYILDGEGNPVAPGVTGELHIGGDGLARGYLERADLTAEKFIPNPFAATPGARMYRSGDLARFRPDGNVEYLGRADDQVKIRGFRIELGEIEAALAALAAVREAVVLVREDSPGDKRLAAYLLGAPGAGDGDGDAAALRAALQQSLPGYMVPSHFTFLEKWPLNPSGKIDRKALPAPGQDRGEHGYVAPRTPREQALAQLWAEVLKLDRVGIYDDFFALGGHSMLAMTLIERMRRSELAVDVRALFTTPTVAALAALAGAGAGEVAVPPNGIAPGCSAITPAMLPLVALNADQIALVAAAVPGGAANIQDIYPLAPLQEGILFHHLLSQRGDAYLVPVQLGFDTRARLDAVLAALEAVIARHDILRTALVWDGVPEPLQVVWRSAPLAIEELRLDAEDGDVAAQLAARFDGAHYRIDVRQAPLLRGFIAHDPLRGRWLLHLLAHHLVTDRTTLELLFAEVRTVLEGGAAQLAPALPFRNFVAQARLGVSRAEHETFFRAMLGHVAEPTVPFGVLEVAPGTVAEARSVLAPELALRLRHQARRLGVSAASLVHRAWAEVLGRLSGRREVVFGTVLFGRMQGGAGADQVLGLFVNTLPICIPLGALGAEDAVRATHARLTGMLRHEHAPLAMAQRCSAVQAPMPLFTAVLNYRHTRSGPAPAPWPGVDLLSMQERTNYPVIMSVNDQGQDFELAAQAGAPIQPQRLCDYLHAALAQLADLLEHAPGAVPGEMEMLSAAERAQVLVEWNGQAADYPAAGICAAFAAQAARTPAAVALVFEGRHTTYGALNARANQLAHHLRALGVGPDVLVGVCMQRAPDMVLALLGILKAGGAYLPLEPGYPAERLGFMLEQAAPALVLSQAQAAAALPPLARAPLLLDTDAAVLDRYPDTEPAPLGGPANLAYVIYTSGSSGRPKGVAVTHAGIANRLYWMQAEYGLAAHDRVLQKTPFSFDVSVWEFFWPLMFGAGLVLARPDGHQDPYYLAALIAEQNITTLHFVPPMLEVFLNTDAPGRCASVRRVICSGQALPPALQRRCAALLPQAALHNLYGPTEASVDVSYWACRDSALQCVPIGKPIANIALYVLDHALRPVPAGVAGELHIAGVGLARGYLKRADLSAERFIPDPFSTRPGMRMYKTGDLARHLPDGNIEYLGRIDNQVKIRGFRIELGEIEEALAAMPEVRDAVVLAHDGGTGELRLVAYLVAGAGHALASAQLQAALLRVLPDYMVPAHFIMLDQLPLTANGKLDRGALPAPQLERDEQQFVAARDAREATLAAIWSQVLKVERIGVHDNFFMLGGDSILSIQIVTRARQAGIALSPKQLFDTPTIAALAAAACEDPAVMAQQDAVSGAVALLPIQHWLFAQDLAEVAHFNQALLLEPRGALEVGLLTQAAHAVLAQHDALRLNFRQRDGVWQQQHGAPHHGVTEFDLSALDGAAQAHAMQDHIARIQRGASLADGPLLRMAYFRFGPERGRLLLVCHHLVIDGVSWRILLGDLNTAYVQLQQGREVALGAKTSSLQQWSARLHEHAAGAALAHQRSFWERIDGAATPALPRDFPEGGNSGEHARVVTRLFEAADTAALLTRAPAAYRTQVNDLLLAALCLALNEWLRSDSVTIALEGHGREALFDGIDVSRTVGWFTALYPVQLALPRERDGASVIKSVKEQLRAIPDNGIGYGLLRYLAPQAGGAGVDPAIAFNYLGQIDQAMDDAPLFRIAAESSGASHSAGNRRAYDININALVTGARLQVSFAYGAQRFKAATIAALAQRYEHHLLALIGHCAAHGADPAYTPSDFALADLDQDELDALLNDQN